MKIIQWARNKTYSAWWFRVFGWGLHYTNHRRVPMYFSEREGYIKAIHFGPHCLKLLTPRKRT